MWSPEYKTKKANTQSTPFDETIGDLVGNYASSIAAPALANGIDSATDYIKRNKSSIANTYVDALEVGLNASVAIGKEVLKELKKRHDDNWDSGWQSIKKAATTTKKNFNDAWSNGMTSIVNGIKNFASLWKSGW